jgi:cell division protein FtsI (penicillin-binding protein 3)
MSSIKGQIQSRSLGTFIFISCIGLIIIYGIIRVQQNEELINQSVEKNLIFEETIPAVRGNIFADDGKSLLATSIPYYEFGIDAKQAKDPLFKESIDSLSLLLAKHFGGKTRQEYKELITSTRKHSSRRYVLLLNRRISHQEKEIAETFPLFREGKFKGGGILSPKPTRSLPFNSMAMITIGRLDRETKTHGANGIEYAFDPYLAGINGKALVKRLAGGVKLPIDSEGNTEAHPGMDVITTINVNFQDIVEDALYRQVSSMNAKYGSAIVMEIETGEIKAITNLSRRNQGGNTVFVEDLNHSVLASTDPGSTFKLATMMAVLEKTGIRLDDFAGNCTGVIKHRGLDFTCDHHHGELTVREVFEKSCNIGIYRLIEKAFGMNGFDEYRNYLTQFRLDQPIGFQLKGEKSPYIKTSKDDTYSPTTLPWMGIGYESDITPVQMLAFYNSVANKGYWIEPYLVKEIREGNQVVEQYKNRKESSRISSRKTIEMALEMMRGVVENGTAQGISEGFCKVAGKTGTAQKLLNKGGYDQQGRYYTSFIGYFPADNPKYSCIVVIDEPQGNRMFASKVCAPVFREIADKIFAYDVEIHPAKQTRKDMRLLANQQKAGMADDLQKIASELKLSNPPASSGIIRAEVLRNDALTWQKVKDNNGLPDVTGMTLRDALPLLENKGYIVRHRGIGKVKEYTLSDRKTINLVLN